MPDLLSYRPGPNWRAALGIIFCTAGLVIGWFELVSRHCF